MCQGLKKVPLYFSSSNISRINSNISNRLLTYNYFNDALCGNEVFSVLNVPYGATVSWPKSANLSFDGSSTGSTVTIYPTSDGASWVEPSITKGSTSVSFPRNNFWAGEPHDLELYCEGRGMLYTYDFYVTPFYDNDSIVWGVYPPPAEINVHGYGTATIYFDEHGFYDIWAYVANECGDGTYAYITDFYVSDDYYLLSPNPANNEIEITFNDDQSANSKSADLPEEEYLVTITDINGIAKIQKEYKGIRFTIPINNLKDGNYFVNLSNDKMNKTQQLIIKH